MPAKKIAIIGPESTGKSTLCEHLADYYHTSWVKEYARTYLLTNGKQYSFDDLLSIAKNQLIKEKEGEDLTGYSSTITPSLLFIDTEMYVMKVWCEYVFNDCHRWILDQIAGHTYDLFLLCNPDLPWESDELRENPDPASRTTLYCYYKDAMINQSTPWVAICGTTEERLKTAISAVDRLLQA